MLHHVRPVSQVRLNPQRYWSMVDPDTGLSSIPNDIDLGDRYTMRGKSPWIAEMYGYMFAAAELGVRHVLTRGLVVYPDAVGAEFSENAAIIHYGLACSVKKFRFDKKFWESLDVLSCSGRILGRPPSPVTVVESLCAETVNSINEALCEYYERSITSGGCGLIESSRVDCASLHQEQRRLQPGETHLAASCRGRLCEAK